jgi:hypothetical protein
LSAVQLIRHDGNRLTVEGVYALVSTVPDAERGQSGESVPPPAVIFFFRPTPSWLSPGRYTRSTAAKR